MRLGALQIVGIDCAVDPRNVGVCRAVLLEGRLTLLEVVSGLDDVEIAARFSTWLLEVPRALLALDAPLGWPVPLAEELLEHRAGESLPREANELFRRRTDDVVAERLGKRPLDVGADRIARTAHASLELLRELRWSTRLAIPLAWTPGPPARTSAIEVYPAATLKAYGMPSSGYKGGANFESRRRIVETLDRLVEMPGSVAAELVRSDHLLDAGVCTLAAADFVSGEVIAPVDLRRAKREGWIWVREPGV